jgi:hypothetical protein
MELFIALLTGFFFWLLVFHWYRRASARGREQAGALLFRATSAIPAMRRHRWALVLSIYMFLMLLIDIGNIIGSVAEHPEQQLLPWESFFDVAVRFLAVLLFTVPLGRTDIALEVREEGVFHGASGKNRWLGRLKFTGWNEIGRCKWVSTLSAVQVAPSLGILKIAEDVIAPAERAAVTSALGRFVPVDGGDGALLAQPKEPRNVSESTLSNRRYARLPFQFDLQSLLILTVAVACATSRYAIRYQHLKPGWDAIAKLEAFQPEIMYFGYSICGINFWNCTVKPTDDDLALLEPFVELEILHLSGTAITDAGLKYLKGMKKLQWIFLKNTRVTAEGIADLKQALPRAEIWSADAAPTAPAAPPARKATKKK